MIRPQDDSFHRGSDDPYWNESAWFGFTVPDKLINGWVYFYHRPNMNFSVGGVALWDPSGEYPWNCRYYDWGQPMALPPDADMFDFSLDNGLTVACREPLDSFALGYSTDGCSVDLEWSATAPPQSPGVGGSDEYPTGSEGWGKGHYTQPGHIRGTIQLGGERLDIDTPHLRDHSWGPRRPGTNPRGNFASAVTAEGRGGFCVYAASDLPFDQDPCVGVPDPLSYGWQRLDGKYGRLTSATRTVLERDSRQRPLRVELAGVDEHGRELSAIGTMRNWLWWQGYAEVLMLWSLTEWDFNGGTVIGEELDFFPLHQARALVRG